MATKKTAKRYVDGFVLSVPKKKLAAYKKMAAEAGKIWMKCGALEYYECVGDDLQPDMMKGMKVMRFPQMAKAKPDEIVFFSYITYTSRSHRDKVNAKVMKAMNEKYGDKHDHKDMPFDMERMAYGGFDSLVHYRK